MKKITVIILLSIANLAFAQEDIADKLSKELDQLISYRIEDARQTDTPYPCYVEQYELDDRDHEFTRMELEPIPRKGYLQRLSDTLRIKGFTDEIGSRTDSIRIRFLSLRNSKLTDVSVSSPEDPNHQAILDAFKRNACGWSVAQSSGRPLKFRRRITIHYTLNRHGDLASLDSLIYRYSD